MEGGMGGWVDGWRGDPRHGASPGQPVPPAPPGCAEFPGLVFMVSPSSDLPQMLTQCHVSDCSLSCAAGG